MSIVSIGQVVQRSGQPPFTVAEWDAYVASSSDLIPPVGTPFRDVRTGTVHFRVRPHAMDMCVGTQRVVFFSWSRDSKRSAINVHCAIGFDNVAIERASKIAAALRAALFQVSERFRALEKSANECAPYAADIRTLESTNVVRIDYCTPDNGGEITATPVNPVDGTLLQGLEVFRGASVLSITRSNILIKGE
jgi:hypothetical protein